MPKTMDPVNRLAGGFGAPAAIQPAEQLLRRAVMACLLWEELAYETGAQNKRNIAVLIPQVAPDRVAAIALEARLQQKLRHVPLYLAVEMLKHESHRPYVAALLPQIINRADQLTDALALYWKAGKKPLAKALQKGLATAFGNFDEYQFAKYDRDNKVKLRDVLFLTHPKPADAEREALYRRIAERTLSTPDTWEVALSAGGDKKTTWERLINEQKLGPLAFLRNLRNMREAGVERPSIQAGFAQLKSQWLLPLNFLNAYRENPEFVREIEQMMFRMFAPLPKLAGHTVFVVDVSGSMWAPISGKSKLTRQDVASAMAVFAGEMCDHITIYATAGNDGDSVHATAKIIPHRGFALLDEIEKWRHTLGGGGIFTRQCLEWIAKDLRGEKPARIIVFSDSQDCDHNKRLPQPFGEHNYIVDVSAHARGVNYEGVWTTEMSGWSEHFLTYIAALEGLQLPEGEAGH